MDLLAYRPLVKSVACQVARGLPASVELADLEQYGWEGLLDAATRYVPGTATFKTYAAQRVRGAMLDGLRAEDPAPRSMRRGLREIAAAYVALRHELGCKPLDSEVAYRAGVSLSEYYALRYDASAYVATDIEDATGVQDNSAQPDEVLERHELGAALHAVILSLPDRERAAVEMHYGLDLNLKEVGACLGVTESRACQLCAAAIKRLRAAVL